MHSFTVPVPRGFDLTAAVCSYGWAFLAPNRWIRESEVCIGGCGPALERPLRAARGQPITVCIKQSTPCRLTVSLSTDVAQPEVASLKQKVVRMLRLDKEGQETVKGFQAVHPLAEQEGFGRLFRSPTIWEDLVKCILLCNCGWGRTVAMNAALCELGGGAFPSAEELAACEASVLQQRCGLGYRTKSISKLAAQVASQEVDLTELEDGSLPEEDLLKRLRSLPGIGPFSAANMLQLLGRYSRIACDTETVRHLRGHHKRHDCTLANVQQVAAEVYSGYAPFQFIAYWHELWRAYEQLFGPFATLNPLKYTLFTGHNMRKATVVREADAALIKEAIAPLPAKKKRVRKVSS